MILQRIKNNQVLVPRLKEARTSYDRTVGLLGLKELPSDQGLWIHRCNSIHTFFMKFSIDCVFMNKNFEVVSVVTDVQPWRLVFPRWGASSVVELAAGVAKPWNLEKGEKLHVGS